jgi:hypothetical protein
VVLDRVLRDASLRHVHDGGERPASSYLAPYLLELRSLLSCLGLPGLVALAALMSWETREVFVWEVPRCSRILKTNQFERNYVKNGRYTKIQYGIPIHNA